MSGGQRRTPRVGTGGHGRKALEGRGPTPKAEDRAWHPAGKRKAADRVPDGARDGSARDGARGASARDASGGGGRGPRARAEAEIVAGRNAVLEALRVGVPATALLMVTNLEPDDRLREAVGLANTRGIPLQEVTRPELDQTCGVGAVHQGLAVRVPPYAYHHPEDLLDRARATGATPLFVALDGITDPRNLGAIVRSAAAFGAHGVIVPQRRAAGMTAAAWKTSAGAAARLPVALAANLTQTLTRLRERGLFVVGLDVDGTESLPGLALADRPLVLVVGSEGRGMSRLVAQTCDAMVSIPISATTESLNAGIAASVALYEVSQRRARTR